MERYLPLLLFLGLVFWGCDSAKENKATYYPHKLDTVPYSESVQVGNMFDIQKEQLALRTYDAFIESGGYLDTKRFSISESLKLSQREMFSEVFKNKKFVTQVSFHHDTNYFILNQYKWALKEVQGAIGIIENYLANS